jgi:hypothetical protein
MLILLPAVMDFPDKGAVQAERPVNHIVSRHGVMGGLAENHGNWNGYLI